MRAEKERETEREEQERGERDGEWEGRRERQGDEIAGNLYGTKQTPAIWCETFAKTFLNWPSASYQITGACLVS